MKEIIFIVGLIILVMAGCILAHQILERRKRLQFKKFKAEMSQKRLPMSEAAFISSYGRALNPQEEYFIKRMRLIFGLISALGPEMIYPHDKALELFGPSRLTRKNAAERLILEMDGQSLILDYGLYLKRAANFEIKPVSVSEFIDSLIAASAIHASDSFQKQSTVISGDSPGAGSGESQGYHVRALDIQPRHVSLMTAIINALSKTIGLDRKTLELDLTLTKLFNLHSEYIDDVDFIICLEDLLGVGIDFEQNNPYQYLFHFSEPEKFNSSKPLFYFGDWLNWFIYNFLDKNWIFVSLGEGESWQNRVKISGRTYLESWEIGLNGLGWSRFNDAPETKHFVFKGKNDY